MRTHSSEGSPTGTSEASARMAIAFQLPGQTAHVQSPEAADMTPLRRARQNSLLAPLRLPQVQLLQWFASHIICVDNGFISGETPLHAGELPRAAWSRGVVRRRC
jgi:hypothetical protein